MTKLDLTTNKSWKWFAEKATPKELSELLIEMPQEFHIMLYSRDGASVLPRIKSSLPRKDVEKRKSLAYIFNKFYRSGVTLGNIHIRYVRDEKNRPATETWNLYNEDNKKGRVIMNINLEAFVPSYDWEPYTLDSLHEEANLMNKEK